MVKKIIVFVICIAILICIPVFGTSGFQNLPSLTQAPNLAQTALKTIEDENGKNKAAFKAVDGKINSAWKANGKQDSLTLTFTSLQTFNTIILREKNWNIKKFQLYYLDETENWNLFYAQDKIEDYRYCTFDPITTTALKFEVTDSNEAFKLREIEIFNVPKKDRDDFLVTAYLSSAPFYNGDHFDSKSPDYLHPDYFNTVNQLNLFLNIGWDAEGNINVGDEAQQRLLRQNLKKMRNVIGDRDVKIFATVGMGPDPDTCLTTHREKLAQNVAAFIEAYGFDGLSYNWEFPNGKKQYNLFSQHIVDVTKLLHENDKLFSAAWYAWGIKLSEEAIQAHDQLLIMGYDTFDQDGNNASFLSGCVQSIEYFLDLGFTKEQISIGMPQYGRPPEGEPIWERYDNPVYDFDYFDNYIDGQWFSGEQMIRDKTAYAIAMDIAGVMLFRLEIDRTPDDDHCLVTAVKTAIQSRSLLQQPKQRGGTQS